MHGDQVAFQVENKDVALWAGMFDRVVDVTHVPFEQVAHRREESATLEGVLETRVHSILLLNPGS